jgi:hypothetical protein
MQKEQKMSASLEALAMAGADYTKFDRNIDEVNEFDPPYLLAGSNGVDEESHEQHKCVLASLIAEGRSADKEEIKEELVLWAKAVAASVRKK